MGCCQSSHNGYFIRPHTEVRVIFDRDLKYFKKGNVYTPGPGKVFDRISDLFIWICKVEPYMYIPVSVKLIYEGGKTIRVNPTSSFDSYFPYGGAVQVAYKDRSYCTVTKQRRISEFTKEIA